MTGELETVATFNDLTQAQNARSALESAEIESILRDETTGSIDWALLPALGGLRLQVKSADVAGAREVLADLDRAVAEAGENEPEDPEETAHRESARRWKRWVGLIAFLILFLPMLVTLALGLLDW
jgi:hypothetical protein